MSAGPFLDTAAVAARLGVAAATVRKYRAEGRMPEPDILLGQSPGWLAKTIEVWVAGRPGQGAGGGRPRKAAPPAGGGS